MSQGMSVPYLLFRPSSFGFGCETACCQREVRGKREILRALGIAPPLWLQGVIGGNHLGLLGFFWLH